MGWIPASLTEELRAMVSIASRNYEPVDRYIGWYPEKEMLVAFSERFRTAAYLKVDERIVEFFPEKSCRLWIPKGKGFIMRPVRVAPEDEAPDAIRGFKSLFAGIGDEVMAYAPISPDMKLGDYSELIREITDRRVKASGMYPFRDWSFDKIVIHRDGVRFVNSGRRQLVIAYKPFRKKREFEKTKKISDFFKEL